MQNNRHDDGAIQRAMGKIRCFALDMDGTFYLGSRILPGSLEFLRRVEESGRKYVFLTNNSSKSGADYREKLAGMGVEVRLDQIVTSGQATVHYLREHRPGKGVYLLGNESLRREFLQGGVILEERDPDIVVTAFDLGLDYARLTAVCDFVREGREFIGTHPDYNCPTETGYLPDIGATHAFIHASTGRWPDKIIGKPNGEIIHYALEQAGCAAAEAAMVGDRLYTDVAAGVNHGLCGILVLSGETKAGDIPASEVQPHLVFGGLGDMIPYL